MFSTTFLKLLIENIHVTKFAAIQLVMIQAMTSLMLRNALSAPGIAPQSAPASSAAQNASSQMSPFGILPAGTPSATAREASVPIRY